MYTFICYLSFAYLSVLRFSAELGKKLKFKVFGSQWSEVPLKLNYKKGTFDIIFLQFMWQKVRFKH
jgi:hypothetical protein